MDQIHAGIGVPHHAAPRRWVVAFVVPLAVAVALALASVREHVPTSASHTASRTAVHDEPAGRRPMIRPTGIHTVKIAPRPPAHGVTVRHRVKWG